MNCGCNNDITQSLIRIVRMQREAVREELSNELCSGRSLGCGRRERINTRPMQIFTDDDKAWGCPIFRNEDGCEAEGKTCVFRVERVEGCTATFRALISDDHFDDTNNPCKPGKFKSTDSFKTIKLCDIAAIRCLNDTFVDLCIR